jgi:YD repeat-containing protein
VADPLDNRTSFTYDALLRPTEVCDALGNRTTTVYDAASRPIAMVDSRGYRTTTSYDAASRAIEVQDALGKRVTTVYEGAIDRCADIDPGRPPEGWYVSPNRFQVGSFTAKLSIAAPSPPSTR